MARFLSLAFAIVGFLSAGLGFVWQFTLNPGVVYVPVGLIGLGLFCFYQAGQWIVASDERVCDYCDHGFGER